MPIIHGAKLRFGVWKSNWHGIIRKPRRHDMMVHVDAPIFLFILIHSLFG
jgi:hypothetical protein